MTIQQVITDLNTKRGEEFLHSLVEHYPYLSRAALAGARLANDVETMPQPTSDRTGIEWMMWQKGSLNTYRAAIEDSSK